MPRSVAQDSRLPVVVQLVDDDKPAKLGPVDISNMPACVADSEAAFRDEDAGPPDARHFIQLGKRLQAASLKLPPIYRDAIANPFIDRLEEIGPAAFMSMRANPDRSDWPLLQDIAHSVLQPGEGFEATATAGFQEVVSDLYDGFLSAEDRRGVKPPDRETLAPLVKWGNPDDGPYTWTIEATESFGCKAAVVSLPPGEIRKGIMGWATLGHECGGHDITHADRGLLTELERRTLQAVTAATDNRALAQYWSTRIDETSADVLGILNMGPAAAISLIGYFRGMIASVGRPPKLRSTGLSDDPHPGDLVRGYLGAAVVRLLDFARAQEWADLIDAETDKDAGEIRLGGQRLTREVAKASVAAVAEVLVNTPMRALEQHSFGEIQNWKDDDEQAVVHMARELTKAGTAPVKVGKGIFAAHTVAAGVYAALAKGAKIDPIFKKMVATLKLQHDKNPAWGPVPVRHPGNLERDRIITLTY